VEARSSFIWIDLTTDRHNIWMKRIVLSINISLLSLVGALISVQALIYNPYPLQWQMQQLQINVLWCNLLSPEWLGRASYSVWGLQKVRDFLIWTQRILTCSTTWLRTIGYHDRNDVDFLSSGSLTIFNIIQTICLGTKRVLGHSHCDATAVSCRPPTLAVSTKNHRHRVIILTSHPFKSGFIRTFVSKVMGMVRGAVKRSAILDTRAA